MASGNKRQVIHAPGLPHHRAPIPTVVRVGNLVFSSAIGGHDPETGKVPAEPEKQVANAFRHMKVAVEAAGGSTDNIGKVVVYLSDNKNRELINVEWLKMFPSEDDRPARHAIVHELPADLAVQIEFFAVL